MKKDFIVRRSITMIEGNPHVETYSEQELVRCKDCRWGDWSRNGKDEEMILCYNGDTGIEDGYLHEPDWFCAEGERKDT